jgi:hypothetical protein
VHLGAGRRVARPGVERQPGAPRVPVARPCVRCAASARSPRRSTPRSCTGRNR